jgi:hypothetical protein
LIFGCCEKVGSDRYLDSLSAKQEVSMKKSLAYLAAILAVSFASASSPVILYTDIISGPTTGGEDNKGIYLSVFGRNFGATGLGTTVRVFIGSAEVDNYRYLGASRGVSGIQQITVQVGALGSPVAGTPLPIKVVVGGVASNTNNTFMPNPGRILFVDNVTGNDATAVIGDTAHPFRHVQTPTLSQAAWGQAHPGDFIVMRGKGTAWTDVGFENYFMRYRDKSGSAPTGASGTGPIVIMGYPGEDVFIHGTLAAGMTGGCISAINGQTYPTAGKWAVISNLRIDCEGYDGPISQEIYGDNWRIVNNELSASTAPTSGPNVPRMAGITGNGQNSVWLGNHIHDVQGSEQECHGIYIDGDGAYEIAYNYIHNIRSGNGFQVYVNGTNGSDVANNINFHHNWINTVTKHGINIGDGSSNNFRIYDNVVLNTAIGGIRFNTTDLHGCKIYNNTFYNCNTSANSNYGMIMNDWNLPNGALDVRNNIFCPHTGTSYNGGSNGVGSSDGTFSNNLWYGGNDSYAIDASPITGDPKFVATGTDFHVQDSSPAVNAGTNAVSSVVTDDFDGNARPQGAGYDVGAFEFIPAAGTAAPQATRPADFGLKVCSSGHATRIFYSSTGRQTALLVNARMNPGLYSENLVPKTLAHGVYFLRLHEGSSTCTTQLRW